jgi:hypothetical protein
MKKIGVILILLSGIFFTSCATLSNAVAKSSETAAFSYVWKNYSYDKVFNAALYALNIKNETIVDANRSSGVIHTKFSGESSITGGNGYYLITPGDKVVFYSSSVYIEVTQQVRPYDDYFKVTGTEKSENSSVHAINAGSPEEGTWIAETKKYLEKVLETRKSEWQSVQQSFVDNITDACKILGVGK